jgi:transcriptional regulator
MNMKGGLQLLILHTLLRGPAHGYQIAQTIKKQSNNVLSFAEGTLYPTLHGMEKQGLVSAEEVEENGRTRRYYRLTDQGRGALEAERKDWAIYMAAMNTILGDAS